MTYTAWSVVYGETPSATKWSQLGENDAGFKDGTNFDDQIIHDNHLNGDVCGSAISQDANGALRVNKDDATIEIVDDKLQVKDKGILPSKMDFDYAVGTAADDTVHSSTAAVGAPDTVNSVEITVQSAGLILVLATGKFLSGGTSGEANVLISTPAGATKLAGGIEETYLTAYLPFSLAYIFSVATPGTYIFSLKVFRDGSTGNAQIKQDSILAIGLGT
jgi:hypothetical protein